MKPRPSVPVRGFTLVELQIALLIVAVMAALMSGALRLSSKTWASVHQQQDQVEHRYFLAQYLRRHLGNARFMRVTTEEHGSVIGFFGNEETVNFVAPWPAFHNDGKLYWWNLSLEEDGQTHQVNLVASYFSFQESPVGNYRPEPQNLNDHDQELLKFDRRGAIYLDQLERQKIIVAENVVKFELEYFYRDEHGVQQWTKAWEAGSLTPLVIKINVALDDGGRDQLASVNQGLALPEITIQPIFADQNLHLQTWEEGHGRAL